MLNGVLASSSNVSKYVRYKVNGQENKGLHLKSSQQKKTKSHVLAKEHHMFKAWGQRTHHLLHYSILHQILQTTEADWASFGSCQNLCDLCHTQTISSWALSWVRSSDTTPRWAGRRGLGGSRPPPSPRSHLSVLVGAAGSSSPQLVSSMRKSGTGEKKALWHFQTLLLWAWKDLLIFLTRTSLHYSEGRLLRRGIYPLKTCLWASWAYFFAQDFLRDLSIADGIFW